MGSGDTLGMSSLDGSMIFSFGGFSDLFLEVGGHLGIAFLFGLSEGSFANSHLSLDGLSGGSLGLRGGLRSSFGSNGSVLLGILSSVLLGVLSSGLLSVLSSGLLGFFSSGLFGFFSSGLLSVLSSGLFGVLSGLLGFLIMTVFLFVISSLLLEPVNKVVHVFQVNFSL